MFTQTAWPAPPLGGVNLVRSVLRIAGAGRADFLARTRASSRRCCSSCTWFSPDAGMGVVATIAQQEHGLGALCNPARRVWQVPADYSITFRSANVGWPPRGRDKILYALNSLASLAGSPFW